MESSDLIRTKFQYVAKLRLNVLFAGIAEGAHRACVLLVIIATSRPLRPLPGSLTWAFERLGTHREQLGLSVEQLTPAVFKATLALRRARRPYTKASGSRIPAPHWRRDSGLHRAGPRDLVRRRR
jgi:hypothetical protein